jgi:hypothetical protein
MKKFILLLLVSIQLASYGQAKISMSPFFSITPFGATSPSSTVNYSTTVTFFGHIVNTGNAQFTGSVAIQAMRDTTSGVFLDSTGVFANLLPSDSVAVSISFIPSPGNNAFKSGGNGNTIVVWPKVTIGTAIIGDSVRPVIYVNATSSIFEFEKNSINLYPNPVLNSLNITSENSERYKIISIYDVFARKIKELSYQEKIDVSDLISGNYWMIISSEKKSYRVSFVKE